jgi:hypothetical protein
VDLQDMQDLEALVKQAGNLRAERPRLSRREALRVLGATAGCALLTPELAFARAGWAPATGDDDFLDDFERQASLFFWEQGSPVTGQVLDRARNDLGGARDPRRMASIASTGFGLTALAIADSRGYLPHEQIVERVRTTLDWHLNKMPEVHGFFFHFTDIETGARWSKTELSSIDTSILLSGVLTARAWFDDPRIKALAGQIYERVDWTWLLNGGTTFSMGWKPETGFMTARWRHYCELTMIYLLAIGSPTHPVPPEIWNNFTRPVVHYEDYAYISGNDPLFTHQYSQAWFDFRDKRDAYANYFNNSVTATRAHMAYCLAHPELYNSDYWGVSASDSAHGYTAWGGPPSAEKVDGTVAPCAAAGSLPFLPSDCMTVLRAMRARWGAQAWGRYGFVDAFHPSANWYDPDVLGIDQGVSILMAENLRTGMVWKTFMRNPECARAMQLAGFRSQS